MNTSLINETNEKVINFIKMQKEINKKITHSNEVAELSLNFIKELTEFFNHNSLLTSKEYKTMVTKFIIDYYKIK